MTAIFSRCQSVLRIGCASAIAAAPLFAQTGTAPAPPPLSSEIGTFRSDTTALRYALDRPAGPGPFPIIVFVHGSGRTTRDEMLNIVPKFIERGFAVFRYDKRGIGESGGVYRGVNAVTSMTVIPELARDAAAAYATACSARDIDPKRCGFFGASQAGWIIPEAMQIVKTSAFGILQSGATIPVGLQMFYGDVTAMLADTLDRAYSALSRFKDSPGYDTRPALGNMRAPTLWLLGMKDRLLPNRNIALQLDSLRVNGLPVTVQRFPEYGHALGPDMWPAIDGFLARFKSP